VLLLDTAGVPLHEWIGAFRTAFDRASLPCRVEQLEAADRIPANLFTADASWFRLVRTPRHVRMDSPPVVAIAFPIPYDVLGLPEDLVRAAAPRLAESPLHDLVHEYLRRLAASAGELAGSPAAGAVGAATVELVRALLISAAGDDPLRRAGRYEALQTRVQVYVSQHLFDAQLTPATIAWAHNVSVRQIYKAFAEAGLSLEQWIIDRRLEAARTRLTSAEGRRRSIAAVARACGFRDASHFARRFRAAYGMTPHEWQRLSAEEGDR
jgi:AraC-like DNA-binding protein